MPVDVLNLPAPPGSAEASDVASLPAPPNSRVASLPAPPVENTVASLPPPSNSKVASLPPPPSTGAPAGATMEKSRGEYLGPEEAQRVAEKYGVSAEKLQSLAPYYNVNLLPSGEPSAAGAAAYGAKSALGRVGETAGLNIPQYAYKKLALSEPERRALDELRDLSEQRKSGLSKVAEFGGMMAAPAVGIPRALTRSGQALEGASRLYKAGQAAEHIAGGAGVGAIAGAAGSREGEEKQGAKSGAIFGAGLSAGATVLGKILSHVSNPAEREMIRNKQVDIDRGREEIAGRTGESEQSLQDVVLGERPVEDMSPESMDKIVDEQYSQKYMERALDPDTPEGAQVRNELNGPVSEQSIRQKLAQDAVDGRIRGFAEDLSGKKGIRYSNTEAALEAVEKEASRQGAEAIAEKYKNYVAEQQANRYIEEQGLRGSVNQPGWFGQSLNKISDNQFVLRHIDDKTHVGAEKSLRDLNTAVNRLSFARQESRGDVGKFFDMTEKAGIAPDLRDGGHIIQAIESGSLDSLAPAEKQAAEGIRSYFDKWLDFVNGAVRAKDPGISPMSIPRRENYVPHIAIDVPHQVTAVEQRVPQAVSDAERILGRPVESLGDLTDREINLVSKQSKPLQELQQFGEWAEGKSARDGTDLQRQINENTNSAQGRSNLESRARAAMERQGGIPEFLREQNVYKLMDKWAHNTLNHLYLRNPLDKMARVENTLRSLKSTSEADYVGRIIQDTLGTRPGTAASGLMTTKTEIARKLDKMIDEAGASSPKGVLLTAARLTPDAFGSAMGNIYHNQLSTPKAALQHLVTSVARVAPELGGTYGYSTVARGALKTLLNYKQYIRLAEQMGNIPAEIIRQGESAMATGIAASKAFRMTREGYQALAKYMMSAFQAGEKFNRALKLGVADMMASDLARGSSSAQKSLRNFPEFVQREVAQNAGNELEVARVLGKHLNDTTSFQYTRPAMAEIGRTVGPLLATFSKWPTAILGEAAYTYRSKGLVRGSLRNMERLLAPTLLLGLMDYGLGRKFGSPEDSNQRLYRTLGPDRMAKLTGSHGLAGMAPIHALHGYVTGEVFTPPAIDILMKGLVIPAFSGDAEKTRSGLNRGFEQALQNYLPGSGLVRMITDDALTLATGRKPEGSGFLEKTQEGTRRIVRGLK